ncbi:MAG: hypothetical protein LQ338_002192 [Usnochroma carphineum]|nr:MAG: hypothetical protein LQ338_002192 [Usnochroma carphineum]
MDAHIYDIRNGLEKKENTAAFVTLALGAGFRAFDTAAQPKHYYRHPLDEAIKNTVDVSIVTPKDVHPSAHCGIDDGGLEHDVVFRPIQNASSWDLKHFSACAHGGLGLPDSSDAHSATAMAGISERVAALGPTIERLMSIGGTAGLSQAFCTTKKLPMTEETITPACSLAKAMTAASIALLVEDKKLTWDTRVKDVLPEFEI